MGKKRGRAAATVDDLDGEAASRVHFVRTDARAAVKAAASHAKLKEVFASDLEPQWTTVPAEVLGRVLQLLSAAWSKSGTGDPGGTSSVATSYLCIGRAAVSRALKRGELSAVVLAREAGVPLLCAHMAVLAEERGTLIRQLPCGSAQLGQPFGLLRASTVGLRTSCFGDSHELLALLRTNASPPLPWLRDAKAARTQHAILTRSS